MLFKATLPVGYSHTNSLRSNSLEGSLVRADGAMQVLSMRSPPARCSLGPSPSLFSTRERWWLLSLPSRQLRASREWHQEGLQLRILKECNIPY
jgi:hypothetical protein